MNITVIATGKCKDKHINALADEFIKRLKPFFPTKLIEVPQVKAQSVLEIKQGEAKLQNAKIPDGSIIFALDERGKMMHTADFSKKLGTLRDTGTRNLVFIIGGAEGLDDSVRNKAQMLISLSPMTFPHMMVRPIILEQIYRAGTVLAGHPYHREG
tara:strand:- start:68566 stop:69033 length:468 start_codon:yes stop_codon:yes gene_type:complete